MGDTVGASARVSRRRAVLPASAPRRARSGAVRGVCPVRLTGPAS